MTATVRLADLDRETQDLTLLVLRARRAKERRDLNMDGAQAAAGTDILAAADAPIKGGRR